MLLPIMRSTNTHGTYFSLLPIMRLRAGMMTDAIGAGLGEGDASVLPFMRLSRGLVVARDCYRLCADI